MTLSTRADYIAYQLQILCATSMFAVMPNNIICINPDPATLQTLQALEEEHVIAGKLPVEDNQVLLDPGTVNLDNLHDFLGKEAGRKENLAQAVKPLNTCLAAASGPVFSFDGHVLVAPIDPDNGKIETKAFLAFLRKNGAIGGYWENDKEISIYRADPSEVQHNVLPINNATFNQIRGMMGRQPEVLSTPGV